LYERLLGEPIWFFGFEEVSSARDIVAGVRLDVAVPLHANWISLFEVGGLEAPTSKDVGPTRVQLRFAVQDDLGRVAATNATAEAVGTLADFARALANVSNGIEVAVRHLLLLFAPAVGSSKPAGARGFSVAGWCCDERNRESISLRFLRGECRSGVLHRFDS
jgi:hypothetical protein